MKVDAFDRITLWRSLPLSLTSSTLGLKCCEQGSNDIVFYLGHYYENDVIVHANVSDSAIVAATTKKIRKSYGSFSLANKKLMAVTVPGAGLFLAQSQELIKDTNES